MMKKSKITYTVPEFLIPYLEIMGRIEKKPINVVISEQFIQMVKGYHPTFSRSFETGRPLIFNEGEKTLKLEGDGERNRGKSQP